MICITCGTQFPPPETCPECHWDVDAVLKPDAVCSPGDTLDERYTVTQYLGSGRFGLCMQATDLWNRQEVVLKFIHTAFLPTPPHYKRFIDGMVLLKEDTSPAAGKLMDAGLLNRRVYISTELLDGGTLAQLIRQRQSAGETFSLHEIYPILLEAASVLIECPTVFHGAICPENIFIQSGSIKVTECGLSANLPESVVLHRLAAVPDRNRYVAPEIQSSTGISRRSDVYSMAVILGEMLTLAHPQQNPAEWASAADTYAPGVGGILLKALAPQPKERFRDAEALLTALSHSAGLPAPRFNRSWADGESATTSNAGTQEDKTAQIVMKDVIQQHYEEVTSVRRSPLLENASDTSARYATAEVPSAPKFKESTMNTNQSSNSGLPKPSMSDKQTDSADSPAASSGHAHPAQAQGEFAGIFSDGPPDESPQKINKTEPLISIDDTDINDVLDITDEFEALEEEMLQDVSAPVGGNTGEADTAFGTGSQRYPLQESSTADTEKTVNERGYLQVQTSAEKEEAAAVSYNSTVKKREEIQPPRESIEEKSHEGIDPRFLRAAQTTSSAPPPSADDESDARLEGINPRFLRAAKTLKEAQFTSVPSEPAPSESPFETHANEDEDWRERIEKEVGDKNDSMVSFMPTGQTALKKAPIENEAAPTNTAATETADEKPSVAPTPNSPSTSEASATPARPPQSPARLSAPPPPPRIATKPAFGGAAAPPPIKLPPAGAAPPPPKPPAPPTPPTGARSAAPPPPPPVRK